MAGWADIPTLPKSTAPSSTYKPPGTKTTDTTSGGGGGGGGGGTDPYAQARADAKAAEAKAAKRYAAQADLLLKQANALKIALGKTGFRRDLRRQLAAANLEFGEENKIILAQYARGKQSLERSADATEDNRARSTQEAGQNASRERSEAIQQGIAQGVGAIDQLKAQAASLRNWSFNQGQVESNYTDEMNSLESEHAQMVNSVITARQSAWREREQQKAQLYRGYYDNRGQVLTEMGNKQGEASAAFDMANEQKATKTYKTGSTRAEKSALASLREAARMTGKGYAERATPKSITEWEGNADISGKQDPRRWGQPTLEVKDAEGASSRLRKWEQ